METDLILNLRWVKRRLMQTKWMRREILLPRKERLLLCPPLRNHLSLALPNRLRGMIGRQRRRLTRRVLTKICQTLLFLVTNQDRVHGRHHRKDLMDRLSLGLKSTTTRRTKVPTLDGRRARHLNPNLARTALP
jgi:hypothetical protein